MYDKTCSDHGIFVMKFFSEKFIILLLYDDDMFIVGNDINKIQNLKMELSKSLVVMKI